MKAQTVESTYDEVKTESTEPKEPASIAAEYEVPVTMTTKESAEIETQCNEAYSTIKT